MSGLPIPGVANEDFSVNCKITADELAERVRQIASQVSADYSGKRVVVVGVLKGA